LWLATRVAKEFGVLPSVAARDLDDDPERLSIIAMTLLAYHQAKSAYDAVDGDDKKLEPWKDSNVMRRVKDNTFAAMKERLDHRKLQHPHTGIVGCRLCESESER
jgi:hypothetical protein